MFTALIAAFVLDIPYPPDYLWRFPDATTTKLVIELNEQITRQWADERSLYGWEQWGWQTIWDYEQWHRYTSAITDNRNRREAWLELDCAHTMTGGAQAAALVRLRKLNGDLSGRMPCPVAIKRMRGD